MWKRNYGRDIKIKRIRQADDSWKNKQTRNKQRKKHVYKLLYLLQKKFVKKYTFQCAGTKLNRCTLGTLGTYTGPNVFLKQCLWEMGIYYT